MRSRSLPFLGALLASTLLLAGCSSDDPATADEATTTAPTPASTTAPEVFETIPGTIDTTVAPTTAPAPLAAFATPTAAGTALYGAWTKGDRAGAGALGLAPSAELDKLFASVALPAAKNRGCDDGEFGSASCFFGNGQGGVNVTLSPAPGGWVVSTIDPFG